MVTARPSYSRIKTALQAIVEHPNLELQLVAAASALLKRFGEASHYMESDGFKIAARVHMVIEGENLVSSAKTAGVGLMELATVFDNLKPDVVVTIADRYETLATAVSASYMNIPLAHIQGGEVSGSIDEKVRHAITKLSDLHFVSTKLSAERVTRMGEDPTRVFVTGCPSIDLAARALKTPELSFDPYRKYGGVGASPDLSRGFVVIMQHPVTTEFEGAFNQMMETLYAVSELKVPSLFFWPNVDAGSDGTSGAIRSFREMERPKTNQMHFFRHMESEDFLKLLIHSKALVGNSSVGIRECSFLGVPVVNIGSRQRGRERGRNVIDVDYHRGHILEAIQEQLRRGKARLDSLYGQGDSGRRIADLLAEVPLTIEKQLSY